MANTKRVTLSRAFTDETGRTYQADETVALPYPEAANLLFLGLARNPDPEPVKAEEPEPEPEVADGAKRVTKRTKTKEGA